MLVDEAELLEQLSVLLLRDLSCDGGVTGRIVVEHVRPVHHAFEGMDIIGGILGGIGQDDALESPFVPENVDLDGLARGTGGHADAVEAGHDAEPAADRVAQSALEAAQGSLAEALFVGEGAHAMAIGLLVVSDEVLARGDESALLHSPHLIGAGQIGDCGILGVVFGITSGIGRPVEIRAGSEDHRDAGIESILGKELALLGEEIGVEGGGEDGLVDIEGDAFDGVSLFVPVASGDALGTVGVGIRRLVDAFDGDVSHRLADDRDHVGDRQLVEELLPRLVIVVVDVLEFDEVDGIGERDALGEAVVARIRALLGIPVSIDESLHLIGGGDARIGLGIRRPVGAGEIGDGIVDEAVEVHLVLELIADDFSGFPGGGISLIVEFAFDRLDLVGIAFNGIPGRIGQTRDILGGQDIVQGIVGILADSEVILACIEEVAAFLALVGAVFGILVIGGEEIVIDLDRDFLALSLGQGLRLAVSDKLDGALLGLALFPRKADVELDGGLALAGIGAPFGRAEILHVDRRCDLVIFLVPDDVLQRLLELGVADAGSEGIDHLVGIVPAFPGRGIGSGRGGGVVEIEDLIVVAGLVVFVSDVDVLGIDDILGVVLAGDV